MALAKWGSAAVVALVVLVIIRLVLKYVGSGAPTATAPAATARKRTVVVPLDDLPDLPSNDLLGETGLFITRLFRFVALFGLLPLGENARQDRAGLDVFTVVH